MSILIELRRSDNGKIIGRCDARCYQGNKKKRCVCGNDNRRSRTIPSGREYRRTRPPMGHRAASSGWNCPQFCGVGWCPEHLSIVVRRAAMKQQTLPAITPVRKKIYPEIIIYRHGKIVHRTAKRIVK